MATIFAVMNILRKIKLFRTRRANKILSIFKYKMYLVSIIALNDTEMLAYLSFSQLLALFHFDGASLLQQALSVLLIGAWLVVCFSVYPLTRAFCSRKATHFMNGLTSHSLSTLVLLLKFVAKPLLQGAVHCLLWASPTYLLGCLSLLELALFCVFGLLHVRHRLVLTKSSFCAESLLELLAVVINALLYLKFVHLSQPTEAAVSSVASFEQEAYDCMEYCLTVCVYVSGAFLSLSVLLIFVEIGR